MKKMLSTVTAAFFILILSANVSAMSLNAHNSDLRSIIMLVARSGNLNVSLDDSVKGEISLQLENVEPKKILEIIAKTKNLNIVREGKIYVITKKFLLNSFMKTYVLPIRYGDAKLLRQAVVMSLDSEVKDDSDNNKRNYNYSSESETKYKFNSDGSLSVSSRGNSQHESSDDDDKSNEQKLPQDKRVYVNPEVNAIILFGTQAEYERAKKLLETLDVELKQVSVEAKILAIDKNASKNLGVEWMWSTVPQYPERDIEYHEPTYNSNGTLRSPGFYEETYTRESNENTGHGIIQFGRGPLGIPFEFYYGAKINALITNGKAKILSRPNVTTIQGKVATINVGSSVPVPKFETTNSTTTTSISYYDAGIILQYTPRINADGTITATIHTEVSTPEYVADLKAYRFYKRSADTTVTVKDGEAMVIGGLIGAEESKNISKIPILGDLPILGALFRNHRNSKSESELIIFLTAHVLGGAE